MSEKLSKGSKYKGFEVINVFETSDFHSTVYHLRHEKIGLEIFHLLNDDSENLFSFCFKTPNDKSNGAAHIIEHSVLCGSEKFPLKDPFVALSNQSVKTYLNAMTYPDKTCFPGSSTSKTDYFNLMNVYSDAVFFPTLKKEIFLQEAHRLEVDDKENITIQGVVYNEMKGNYSSFDSVAGDSIQNSLFKNSIYEKDSGGDPLEIPSITYEQFIEFYKKWYRPDNCLVFLYGNIPTCEQIDFLEEKIVGRLVDKYTAVDVSDFQRKKNQDEINAYLKSDEMDSPKDFYYEGPSGDGEDDNVVLLSWNLGTAKNSEEKAENLILYGILANHDSTPLNKALLDSELGEDIAPQSGLSSQYNNSLTFGLRGVKNGNEKQVEKIILDTLERLVSDGVSKKDIDSTLMILEFLQREIKRGSGPYSLSIMSSIASGWCYGYELSENFPCARTDLEKIKKRINDDDSYILNLIKDKLLENKKRVLIVVTPSKSYTEKREKAEAEIVNKLMEKTSVQKIKEECEKLHEFQKVVDDYSCLPHLNPKDFIHDGKPEMDKIECRKESFKNSKGTENPLLVCEENTNGIVYMRFCIPVDVLEPEDYKYLPLLCNAVTDCGWKNIDWAEASEIVALHAGEFDAYPLSVESALPENLIKDDDRYLIGRDWLVFRVSMLEEEIESMFEILSDCISGTDFKDSKRLLDVINEMKNDFESSVVPAGHLYSGSRALCRLSKKNAIDELWNGLSQLYVIQKIAGDKPEETAGHFRRILEVLRNSGAMIHITAEKSGIEKAKNAIPFLVKNAGVTELRLPSNNPENAFVELTELPGAETKNGKENLEISVTKAQVGYASMCVPAASFGTKNAAIEEVCAHWFSNNLLWEKIRTIGGAYGAFCTSESFSSELLFTTYRDPAPMDSCKVFEECIHEAAQMDFSEVEIQKAIMGCYSHFIQPKTPKQKGMTALNRILFGISDLQREEKLLQILQTTSSDVKEAFRRIEKDAFDVKNEARIKSAVLCDSKHLNKNSENKELCGKIITLPL